MKRLFAFVFVLLLCGIGVGFARGWFAVSKEPGIGDHKVDIRVTVDPDKMKADADKASDKVKEFPETIKKRASEPGPHEDEPKESTPK